MSFSKLFEHWVCRTKCACDFLPEAYRERNGKRRHECVRFSVASGWTFTWSTSIGSWNDSAGPWNSTNREKMLTGYFHLKISLEINQICIHSLVQDCMERRYRPPAVHLTNALLRVGSKLQKQSQKPLPRINPLRKYIESIQCVLYLTFYHNTG